MDRFFSTLLIQRMDGTEYDLGKLGIRVKSFDPPSPNYQNTFQQIGSYKSIRTDFKIQQLNIPLVFDVYCTDNYDYELQRLKVLEIFRSQEEFYILNLRTPFIRWKVVAEAFSYPRLNNYWKASNVSITLVCSEGLAESVETTLTMFDSESINWGLGMNFPMDMDVQYQFTNQNQLMFFNASNIPLLGEERPVIISFSGNVSEKLTIKNKTTNQIWSYNRSLSEDDHLVIQGMIPIVNGILSFEHCNHSYLDYAIGWNEIEVSGATNFSLSFETRFYY